MKQYDCILNGIVKHHNGGYTFKMIFKKLEDARKYKEMIEFYVKDDFKKTMIRKGFYDKKEE